MVFRSSPLKYRSRSAPKWIKILSPRVLGQFPNSHTDIKKIFFLSFYFYSRMPRKAKIVSLSAATAALFKKSRQIHIFNNRIYGRRSLSTSILNKKFNSPQQHPHRMTNDPVIITAVNDTHQRNGKWASSLATAQEAVINGGLPNHQTPHHKHAPHPSSIYPRDKAATMGTPQLVWEIAKFRHHFTVRVANETWNQGSHASSGRDCRCSNRKMSCPN